MGKPSGTLLSIAEAFKDQKVRQARVNFLPSRVDPKVWIDQRIGGEVETVEGSAGEIYLRFRAAAAAEPEDADEEPAPRVKAKAKAKVAQSSSERPITAEEFISNLPGDSHTDEETSLRNEILVHLQTKHGSAPLSEMIKQPSIAECKSALLPPEVPLKVWIDSRIGGEVETAKDERGKIVCRLREEMAEEDPEAKAEAEGEEAAEMEPDEDKKEAFFEQFPADGFTADEESLREALLEFLQAFKGSQSPMLSQAEEDPRVRQFKRKVLPKNAPASIADWIHRRIGGEVEVSEVAPGQVFYGFRGQLVLPNAKKRKGVANPEQGTSRKKGGKGGDWSQGRRN